MLIKKAIIEKLNIECAEAIQKRYGERVIVFGEGNVDSRLVLVGEAPGEQEEKQERPFVGQAGKNLQKFLEVLELKRDDIYITNVVKFRPYRVNEKTGRKSNRVPDKHEIGLCREFLLREIGAVSPRIVVTLGNTALKVFMGDNVTIGDCHGANFTIELTQIGKSLYLFCLYHPASIIYRPELMSIYEKDLKQLKEFLKENDII